MRLGKNASQKTGVSETMCLGQMRLGKKSSRKNASRKKKLSRKQCVSETCVSEKVSLGNMRLGKHVSRNTCVSEKLVSEKMRLGKMRLGRMRLGQKMRLGKTTPRTVRLEGVASTVPRLEVFSQQASVRHRLQITFPANTLPKVEAKHSRKVDCCSFASSSDLALHSKFFGFFVLFEPTGRKKGPQGPKTVLQTLN